MSKQDRQGVRTPVDVERKYNLGQLAAARGATEKQQQEIHQLSKTLNQYVVSTNQGIDSLNDKIEDIGTEIDEFNSDVEGFNKTIDELNGKIDELNDKIDELPNNPENPGGSGVSPIIDVTEIEGGHRVTITDAEGTESFDVMNGKDGEKGDKGDKGDSYNLTEADKNEIAQMASELIEPIDTGWLDITLESGISLYTTEYNYLRGRVKDGVLYLQGAVVGIDKNFKLFAQLPNAFVTHLKGIHRFSGVYLLSYFCGLYLSQTGQLYVTANGAGSWNTTSPVMVDAAICL